MLLLFSFFSIISVIMVTCLSIAVINVLLRRESAYLIEERIRVIVESRKGSLLPLLDKTGGCEVTSDSLLYSEFAEHLNAEWPGSQINITKFSAENIGRTNPSWLSASSFDGIVESQGRLEIRFLRIAKRSGCFVRVLVRIPFDESFFEQSSTASGLKIVDSKPMILQRYRHDEGIAGEIEANFMPGSLRPVPVVVVARDWETGSIESWVVCQLRPSYTRTFEDLSRMGLHTASWVFPLIGIALAFCVAYTCGLWLSLRLSRRIVGVIDTLSHAAFQIGMGDFAVRVPVAQEDQLGLLVSSFNAMTSDLETLREREEQRIVLEHDMALAQEAQRYLYPRSAPLLSSAKVWGMTRPARIVSGDLYDFFTFSRDSVGLLCADVSGKGMSAALMMAHLQAVAHGRMLTQPTARPSAPDFAALMNQDLVGRFGDNRYATMFYGEYDSRSCMLRYINAGHCRPVFISATGEVTPLSDGDLPIGLFVDVAYQELQISLQSGSAVVVYSDGLTDALNSEGEEFGEGRLVDICKSLPKGMTAKEICVDLIQCVSEWSEGMEQFDDITILAITAD